MTKDWSVVAGEANLARGAARAGGRGWRRFWWGLRAVQVRLRFALVLVAAFLFVGKWDVLRNYWETLTSSMAEKPLAGAVSPDTEYFCPMCPGVIAEWPSKCSVCNMPLVRRLKGEAVQLPDGVLSRMQLSPYRVQLAG
ncbi:MAG: heavy metal-binding domain-containing protein, partial [Rhodanobacteraceae bacterium]